MSNTNQTTTTKTPHQRLAEVYARIDRDDAKRTGLTCGCIGTNYGPAGTERDDNLMMIWTPDKKRLWQAESRTLTMAEVSAAGAAVTAFLIGFAAGEKSCKGW